MNSTTALFIRPVLLTAYSHSDVKQTSDGLPYRPDAH